MKIRLKNGSLFQLIGSDNIDSIVGTNPVGCVFSEYAIQDPQGWDYIRPILRENKGWVLFPYTPRGKNHGYDMFHMAQNNPDWYCSKLTIEDTGVMSHKDIDEERRAGMDEELIQQEFQLILILHLYERLHNHFVILLQSLRQLLVLTGLK